MSASHFDPDNDIYADGIFGLPHSADDARVVILPIPFDATASYRAGAALAPDAIFKASQQVDLHDLETGDPWQQGIAMLPIPALVLAFNREARSLTAPLAQDVDLSPAAVHRVNQIGTLLTESVREEASRWLAQGKLVGVLGGDHASPLGAIQAVAHHFPGLGILHIDAHADLRRAYQDFIYSHASIMYNCLQEDTIGRIIQVGVRDFSSQEARRIATNAERIFTWFDTDIASRLAEGETFASIALEIADALPDNVYVSFDIDGLDPSLCPNTGTPVPGGLSFNQASYLLKMLRRRGKRIVGFDLCEVAPSEGSIDAIVGARVLYRLIGWALWDPSASRPA